MRHCFRLLCHFSHLVEILKFTEFLQRLTDVRWSVASCCLANRRFEFDLWLLWKNCNPMHFACTQKDLLHSLNSGCVVEKKIAHSNIILQIALDSEKKANKI